MHLLDFKVSRGVRGGKGKVGGSNILKRREVQHATKKQASHNRGTVWHSTGREEQASGCGRRRRRLKGHGDGLSTVLGLVMQA
eukprot:jgi/Chlat1/5043/Chrsp329S04918